MELIEQKSPLTQFDVKYLERLAFTSREKAEEYRIAVTAPKEWAVRLGDEPLNAQELERVNQGATWRDIKAKREQAIGWELMTSDEKAIIEQVDETNIEDEKEAIKAQIIAKGWKPSGNIYQLKKQLEELEK